VLVVTGPDGALLSAVLTFYFRDQCLPYYAGDAEAARDLAANDFKYWELMRRACARGFKVFDYGRSKLGTGAYAFKKNWGFEPQPLSYEFRLFKRDSIPQNNPTTHKYRLFIEAWKRLPVRSPTPWGRTSCAISAKSEKEMPCPPAPKSLTHCPAPTPSTLRRRCP